MSDGLPAPTSITWKPGGPLVVEGPVVIRDNAGDAIAPPSDQQSGTVKLCGCGQSRSKPFCDGSHRR